MAAITPEIGGASLAIAKPNPSGNAIRLTTKPENMQSFLRRTEKEANDSRLMLFCYLILAIVLGLSALWFWQNATPIEEQTSNINVANSKMSERQAAQPSFLQQQQQAEIDDEPLLESQSTLTPSETAASPEVVVETTPLTENADMIVCFFRMLAQF